MYFHNSNNYQNLGHAKEFIWKYCVNFSETFHVPVKYENSNTTAKVSVFLHSTHQTCNASILRQFLKKFIEKQDYK